MRLFLPAILLGLFLTAQAGAVGIKLSGNQDPNCGGSLICVTDGSFPITTNTVGGGFFQAVNEENNFITGLDFNLDYVDPGCATGPPDQVNLSFDSNFLPFATQSLSVSDSSKCLGASTAQYLLALNFGPGIPDNYLFQIDLSNAGNGDPNAPGGWEPSTTFSVATSTATPEPLTSGLASGGLILLVGLGALRRRSATRG